MTLLERAQAPTPKLFKLLRTIGLLLMGIGGVFLSTPVPLPEIVQNISGYMTLAGGVLSAVSQITVENKPEEKVCLNPYV